MLLLTRLRSALLITAIIVVVVSGSLAPSAQARASSVLRVGDTLRVGDRLTSPDGSSVARLKADGNFVVARAGVIVWSTGTGGTRADRVLLRRDGNLVVESDHILWGSRTTSTGVDRVVLRNDGALVASDGTRAAWSSTSGYVGDSLTATRSTLRRGGALISRNGAYRAVVQRDGNFVLYGPTGAIWSSRTAGTDASRVTVQGDHNVVLYGAQAVWNLGTNQTGADRLVVQDDGNLVLYDGARAVWSAATAYVGDRLLPQRRVLERGGALVSANRSYRAVMQDDGNFVVYGPTGAQWSSRTAGSDVNRLVLQTDSNLVLYGSRAHWHTGTTGTGSDRLVMQDDGNLVLYAGARAVWSSRGGRVGGGNIRTPFPTGETWYVYQGYSSGTHQGTSQFGLDLTLGTSTTSTSGRSVTAPSSGTIAYWDSPFGNLCVNTPDGRSYTLTHIDPARTSGSVAAGERLGTVAPAGTRQNNGVAHLHFEMWSGPGCYNRSAPVPLDSGHGARMCGAPDLTATGPNGGNGVWSGTTITGTPC